LLPYYDNLPFEKKYGVNTNDTDFRVIKTGHSSTSLPSNYTFNCYGYNFSKGKCCKITSISTEKNIPCYNIYTTLVVAPDGSTKEFCPSHVKAEVKIFKQEIKKKAIEDKLKAKVEAKQKALADKAAAKEEKALKVKEAKEAKEANKKQPKDEKEPKDENNVTCLPCVAILKTGSRKGEACGLNAFENSLCKRHQVK
jgi:hypothetical protein